MSRPFRLAIAAAALFGGGAGVPAASAEPWQLASAAALLGMAGGLCVGSAADCLVGGVAPGGFDLLVAFDLDSASLTEEAKHHLAEFAVALNSNRLATATFVVEGHSDARGSAAYNLALSEQRAQSVRDYLLEQGVPPEKLVAAGLGEAEPRTSDPNDPANRRVVMKIRLQ